MSAPDNRTFSLMSPGFRQALSGILVTTLAWFGPWSWPAWPAMAVLAVAFSPEHPFVALSYGARSAVVVVLMVVNIVGWALVAKLVAKVRGLLVSL